MSVVPSLPDSVHLTRWPAEDMAGWRDPALEASMAVARSAVDLARTLRGQAGLKARQPLARAVAGVARAGSSPTSTRSSR